MPLAYVRMENGRAVQMELEPPEGEERTGNIYVGKVEKLVPVMQAAFVRISPKQSGYLPLAKAKHPLIRAQRPGNELKEQDELLVQMEREAIKGKLPSLKTSLEFPGSLMVLLTDSQGIFFSPRLSAEQMAEGAAGRPGTVLRHPSADQWRECVKGRTDTGV